MRRTEDRRPRSMSRRRFLGTAAGAGAAAAAGRSLPSRVPGMEVALAAQAPQATAFPDGAAPDLTLVNGRIHTMDARNTIASTVTIRNGRFATVGNAAPQRSPGVQVIDLRGRTVVPGLIEGHIHSVSLANRPGYH